MRKERYNVTGMTCSACSSHVERAVKKLNGVSEVSVNLLTGTMEVTYEENIITSENIIAAVENGGYGASVITEESNNKSKKQADNQIRQKNEQAIREVKNRLITSIIFAAPLMYIAMGGHGIFPLPTFMKSVLVGPENSMVMALTQFLLLLPVLYVNRIFFVKGFKALIHRAPNMDTLVAIGVSAATIYGIYLMYVIAGTMQHDMTSHHLHELIMRIDFESASMILTLVTLGKFFEAISKGKTSQALQKLVDIAPKTATVLIDGKENTVSVDKLNVGDVIVIRPGEAVAADGVVISGETDVNESNITGESIPVEKRVGSKVVAATINVSGNIKVRAEKVGADSTISQIIKIVEEASATKAPIAKLADKVAGIFVPVVIAIATVTFIAWIICGGGFDSAFLRAITVLVISCPCAMGLATPVAIMVGTGKGAEHGILIKSGEAFETAHSIDTILLDKTGTITTGNPSVTDIYTYNNVSTEDVLRDMASLEQKSEHPLAKAIVKKAEEQGVELYEVSRFKSHNGRGVEGITQEGIEIIAGNAEFMKNNGIDNLPEEKIVKYAKEGKTPLLFARRKEIVAIVALRDEPRATSIQAIDELKKLGMEVIMLTGDNQSTAEAIAKSIGIEKVYAEVLPHEKEKIVSVIKGKGRKVAMVGDGVNDAPALVSADFGIAVGAGTDVAIESADAVIIKNDLMDVVDAILLSRATIRNIKQNLFWAFFYNAICIPIAAGAFYPAFGITLKPMYGALAMSISSVFVVMNALRLKLFKPKNTGDKKESSLILTQTCGDTINENDIENNATLTKVLSIEGMSCIHCVNRVENSIRTIEGVEEVEVSLEEKQATIKCTAKVRIEDIIKAVEKSGYKVTELK